MMLSPQVNLRWRQLSGRRSLQHVLALVTLTVISAMLFFYHADRRDLWSSHEGRAGQHAQLMLNTGHWGMPTLYYGGSDYQKPPLYYWMVAVAAWLRGGEVDAWAIRFPAALAAMLGVWVVYGFGNVLWRPSSGFVAALVLACNLRFSWLARVGRIDMPLTLAVTVVLACFYLAYRSIAGLLPSAQASRAWRWMMPAYLAVAVAVMLKGPVGLVLPVIPICLFLAWEGQPVWPWKRGFGELMKRLGAWWGVPLVLLIATPWFVWASVVTDGAFFKTFFLHHNLDRTLGVEGLKPEPVWFYVPQIFVDMFPWSMLIPAAIGAVVRQRRGIADSAGRFMLCWAVGIFAFLSLVRFKRHDYVLPLVPGLALLLANFWNRFLATVVSPEGWRWPRVLGWVTIAYAAVFAAGVLLIRADKLPDWLFESRLAGQLIHDTDRMVVGKLQGSLADLGAGSATLCALIGAAGIAGLWAAYRRRPLAMVTLFAMVWLGGFMLYVDQILPPLEPLREQRTLAGLARQMRPDGSPLYYYGREDQQLMFYLGPGSRWLPDHTSFRTVLAQTEPVFIVMELSRYLIRQKDRPEIRMVQLAQNTDNPFGTHRDPAVLVTNEAGWRLVETRRAKVGRMAN